MQLQFKETKTMLVKDQVAAKIAVENTPVVHEVQVIDTELINKVTAENEHLKVSLFQAVDLSIFPIMHMHG